MGNLVAEYAKHGSTLALYRVRNGRILVQENAVVAAEFRTPLDAFILVCE